ncbi:MAG: type II toxin-antitoxin system RelE/ParE family toxin [Thermoanaerobaculia bacterium]
MPRLIAVTGDRLTVEWAVDSRGRTPALDYFQTLEKAERLRIIVLFKRLADHGEISSREHFKNLGKEGERLWEFKRHQLRFLGDFRSGNRFLVAHGLRKKRDDLGPADIARAKRILEEHDEREARESQKAET